MRCNAMGVGCEKRHKSCYDEDPCDAKALKLFLQSYQWRTKIEEIKVLSLSEYYCML